MISIYLHIILPDLIIENGRIKIWRLVLSLLPEDLRQGLLPITSISMNRKEGQPNRWVPERNKTNYDWQSKEGLRSTNYLLQTALRSEFEFSGDFNSLIVRSPALGRVLFFKRLKEFDWNQHLNQTGS